MKITDIKQTHISGQGNHPYSVQLRNLGSALGLHHIQVHEEELQPGENASKPHYHSAKEEMVIVLEGTITVLADNTSTQLNSGEFTGFVAGDKSSHVIRNDTGKTARYLSIGSMEDTDETIFI